MTNKNIGVALVVIAIISTLGLFFPKGKQVVQQILGGDSGPVKTVAQEFIGGSTFGLVNSSSTIQTADIMAAGELANSRQGAFYDTYIHQKTGSVATTTLTFPASSTLSYVLPRAGMRTDICFAVATSTGGAGLILAEGTGWKFVVASSTRVQTSSGLAPSSAVSRTVTGGQPTCGSILRERSVSSSPGFVDSTSTTPGDFVLFLTPSYPAQ